MMEFKHSPVIFDEESHSYYLGEKRLLGITGLIHSILGLGVYPDAGEYTKDHVIPRAGSRGTAVHHAIQTYDQLGIRQDIQVVTTKYGCEERGNVSYNDETWDVSEELDAYIRHLKGFKPLANELTVSDNVRYASQIDNVWMYEKTGGIWLVDTKTNNIKLYPLCGYFNPNYFTDGKEALKEYLSWQLSIYAELFEAENPGMKVEGLACNWLRKDAAAFWIIDRKPAELVNELLSTDYVFGDHGPTYFHHDQSVFGIGAKSDKTYEEIAPIIAPEEIDNFATLLRKYKKAEDELKVAKSRLQDKMKKHGIKSYDFGLFSATIAADSETTTFDTKRFKSENADLYSQYITKKPKKGGFTVKLKEL